MLAILVGFFGEWFLLVVDISSSLSSNISVSFGWYSSPLIPRSFDQSESDNISLYDLFVTSKKKRECLIYNIRCMSHEMKMTSLFRSETQHWMVFKCSKSYFNFNLFTCFVYKRKYTDGKVKIPLLRRFWSMCNSSRLFGSVEIDKWTIIFNVTISI